MAIGRLLLASAYTGLATEEQKLMVDSELTVKVVNTGDTDRVLYLRDQPKPTKHLSFHPSGSYLAASCTNGIVYIYSLSTE